MTASEPNLPDDISDVEEISQNSGRMRVALEITVAILILVGIYYLFAPDEDVDLPPLERQEIDPIIRAQIDAAEQEQSSPVPAPAVSAEAPQTDPAQTGMSEQDTAEPQTAPVKTEPTVEGETAREIIAAQRSGADSRPLSELYNLATQYQQQGHTTDAYLLWFFAARQGDGQSAFALASLHDPNHFESGNDLLSEADATQAYKWYSAAAAQAVPQARERLDALRLTLQQQADGGDLSARRLLLNWQ